MVARTEIGTNEKLDALKSNLADMRHVIVAYSGGVDSAFLAAVANEVLGQASLAVTAKSPSLARSELEGAVQVAATLGLNHRVIETAEVERDDYRVNDPNRCFFCKEELYTHLSTLPEARYSQIINAHNLDDTGDFRPGINSAKKRGVRSPLVEAGLTKAEIREQSRAMGLPTWDKPAQACLSSRIPYGTPVTVEALARIAEAEEYLRSLGVERLRVRHHDMVARIEVGAEDFSILLDEETRRGVIERFREIGYSYVTLDLEGFRSGSLNEVLVGLRRKREVNGTFQAE
ncbi:MAG: ATP-dependent sacrificial sulfur transferase LarE [Dehalococcoidia bacterium]|nr:ATP-dependent sacrificial sulfur transferase LarE [Dehalococcoidia bacterium]